MKNSNQQVLAEHFARIEKAAALWREPASAPDAPKSISSAAAVIDRALRTVSKWEASPHEESAFESLIHCLERWESSVGTSSSQHLGEQRPARVYCTLADLSYSMGDLARAEQACEKALRQAQAADDFAQAAHAKALLGRIGLQMGRWEEAEHWLQTAHSDYITLHDPAGACECLSHLGRLHYRRGEYHRARTTYSEGLETAQNSRLVSWIAQFHYHLGVLHRMEHGDEETFLYLREALIRFESIRDLRGAADCLNNLGLLFMQTGRRREASASFDQSLELCLRSSNFSLAVFVYLNRALLGQGEDDSASVLSNCEKALDLILRLRDPVGLAKLNRIWGGLYWEAKSKDAADLFYKESMLLYESLGLPLGQANCYLEYGKILCSIQEYDRGVTFLSAARDLYRLLHLEGEARRLEDTLQDAEARRRTANRRRPLPDMVAMPLLME